MISFCITCKNRSKVEVDDKVLKLLPNCITSIAKSCSDIKEEIEIIVSDWGSTDHPINEWIHDMLKDTDISVLVVNVTDKEEFSLSHGRNIAYDNSKGDKLFFLDADMTICPEVVKEGIVDINNGYAFFPICYYRAGPFTDKYLRSKHTKAQYRRLKNRTGWGISSYGNLFISRQMFESIGKWEGNSKYGGEDVSYVVRCLDNEIPIMRKRYSGLSHQWHPLFYGWPHGKAKNPKRKIVTEETPR